MSIGVLLSPADALAQVVQSHKDGVFIGPEPGRLGGSATLSSDVGVGTFVHSDYSDDPYFAQWLRALPALGLTRYVFLQAEARLIWEHTAPSDASGPQGSRYAFDDVYLRLLDTSLYRDEPLTGINLSGGLSVALPLSHESRERRGTLNKLTGSVALDRTFFDRLTFVYTFAATKHFGETTQSVGIVSAGTYPRRDVVPCAERADDCRERSGAIATAWVSKHRVGLAARLAERWTPSLALGFTTYYMQTVRDGSDPESNLTYDNRHQETWVMGDLRLSVRLAERWSVSAGVASEQLWTDARGNPQFPLFDFESSSANYTVFYLSLSLVW